MNAWPAAFTTTPAMAALWTSGATLAAYGEFEAALAGAEAECGVIPAFAAGPIADAARAGGFDAERLAADGARAGALVIPYVKALTAAVRVRDAAAAAFTHFGATSQDVVDTAFALRMRRAHALIDADLARAMESASGLARKYRDAPMLGRTLLQPATPIVFGLKAAQWRLGLHEARKGLARAVEEGCLLQFGGASGNLGSLGARGAAVALRLAARLGLPCPPAPWHARRGAVASLAGALAIVTGAAAKAARDIALMAQFEIGECAEPREADRGGSSAMPHKRNPVRCMTILAAHARAPMLAAATIAAMDQEHERALGGWQAEWSILPELASLAGGALAELAGLLAGLVVDPVRMRANLDALRGLPMSETVSLALAARLGRDEASAAVEAAAGIVAGTRCSLAEVLAADPRVAGALTGEEIVALCDPLTARGSAHAFIDAALREA